MEDQTIDPRAFEFAIERISDGFIFEEFANQFASSALGYRFLPVGGIKDRGIDGLQHAFQREGYEQWIYQSSIEKDPEGKIERTVESLTKNAIQFDVLHYFTNQAVAAKDEVIGRFFEKHRKPLQVFDLGWLATNANKNAGTQTAFRVFASRYLHEYQQPGKAYVVSDLVSDPRLYVFLRQELEVAHGRDINDTLVDTLILFALENTDPNKPVLMTLQEILHDIRRRISFDPAMLHDAIPRRLDVLSTKPRRINHHTREDAYCLPYETRCALQDRNLADAALQHAFRQESNARLTKYLDGTKVRDGVGLIEGVLHRLFHQQGLEFSGFLLKGENRQAVEKNLAELIVAVVDEKRIVDQNREKVIAALHVTIRDIVYNGTPEQKEFLRKLANTYMMLFLLNVDPKITTYFRSMASQLRIYVDNSIIIPALSEYFLAVENRRHWNLLKQASLAGVTLVVGDQMADELVSHFRMIRQKYDEFYRANEAVYLADETAMLYIDEIMIRAYFYSKSRKQVDTFDSFLDKFVDPAVGRRARDDLVTWLQHEFGIRFLPTASVDVHVPDHEVELLVAELSKTKSHKEKARTDAELILSIYHQRTAESKGGCNSSMLGYRTWWLSKDTTTQRAVNTVFGDKFDTSCYIRPDFLHNYICLAPSVEEVDDAYRKIFPSLIGVNISFHLPPDLIAAVQSRVREHGEKNQARLVAVLRDLTDRLKSQATMLNANQVKHFLDERLSGTK
jgi:hypothetical protein